MTVLHLPALSHIKPTVIFLNLLYLLYFLS
jgi:hypothetical protein